MEDQRLVCDEERVKHRNSGEEEEDDEEDLCSVVP